MPGARMRRRKQARDARRQQEGEAGGDEPRVGDDGRVSLFDDDDDATVELQVNEKFKKRFEHNEGLKDKMRLKELEHELGGDDETSESEEDEDADLLTSKLNDDILETLAKIKNKDPAIYKPDVRFFPDEEGGGEGGDEDEHGAGKEKDKKKEKKKLPKKMTVVDMERERILRGDAGENDSEEDEGGEEEEEEEEGYYEKQSRIKDAFKRKVAEDDSDDDLFVPRAKSRAEQEKDDQEFEAFSRDRLAEKAKDPSQTLRTLLTEEAIDDDERFLRNYILGNEWKLESERERRENPSYDDIVGVGGVADSEDEEAVKRAEDFEEKYNFRFEQEGSGEVVGHAR